MSSLPTQILLETPIRRTPRVKQIRGLFDLPEDKVSRVCLKVCLPLDERPWNIGLIVGPSGCGKTSIARHLWPNALGISEEEPVWSRDGCIVDDFPTSMSIKEIIELLCSVGFSSPPAWLRPFHVLSTGQQFRVRLARLLAESQDLVVFDEFTSVVDRTVAQIGSAALAKTVRRRNQQFIAVTCHEDVEDWLQPDWVYRPAERRFEWRCLLSRPAITLDIFRCRHEAWELFAPHHYLNERLARSAICFLAVWRDRPVGFSSWVHQLGKGPSSKREHRTVVLPDYQGAGIGNRLSACIASMWKAFGYRALSTTTHPGMIASRKRSSLWQMHRAPSLCQTTEKKLSHCKHSRTRFTAGFTYIGPAMEQSIAQCLLEAQHVPKSTSPDPRTHSPIVHAHPGRRLRTRRLRIARRAVRGLSEMARASAAEKVAQDLSRPGRSGPSGQSGSPSQTGDGDAR